MKTVSKIILALTLAVLCSCVDVKFIESEVTVFECLITDNEDGMTYRSSELLYGMDRVDIGKSIYFENGLIWVKGKETADRYGWLLEVSAIECNEWLEGCGTVEFLKYSPKWEASTRIQTKSGVTTRSGKIRHEKWLFISRNLSQRCGESANHTVRSQYQQVIDATMKQAKDEPMELSQLELLLVSNLTAVRDALYISHPEFKEDSDYLYNYLCAGVHMFVGE